MARLDSVGSAASPIEQALVTTVRVSRLAVPHLQRRGGGSIIIIASIYGREAGGRMTYNAVKAAQISLGKSLAQQLASSNIRVNSVSPGSIMFRRRIVVEAPAAGPGVHRRDDHA